MSSLLILLIILISVILLSNVIYFIFIIGWYPFTRELKRSREGFFPAASHRKDDRIISHDYQVLNGCNDTLRKWHEKDMYEVKDPASTLEKRIQQYKKDPSKRNFYFLIHLANHVSNRVRYDDRINELIEMISELPNHQPKKE
jgi:hypothetical protein